MSVASDVASGPSAVLRACVAVTAIFFLFGINLGISAAAWRWRSSLRYANGASPAAPDPRDEAIAALSVLA